MRRFNHHLLVKIELHPPRPKKTLLCHYGVMKKIVFLNPQLSPNTIHPMGQKFKKIKIISDLLKASWPYLLQKYKGYGWRVLAGHSTISFQKGKKKISKKVDVDFWLWLKKNMIELKKKIQNIHLINNKTSIVKNCPNTSSCRPWMHMTCQKKL